jgi:hypothetical protein
MSWDNNPYYNPEKYGLEVVGDIEWSDAFYQFDMTVVWFHPESKKYYIAHDSGCSCPSPFEAINELAEIEEVTIDGAIRQLEFRRGPGQHDGDYGVSESLELIKRLRSMK